MKKTPIFVAAALLAAAPLTAMACDQVNVLEFEVEGGNMVVLVNGIYKYSGGEGSGAWPMMPTDFVQTGENEITVELTGDGASADLAMMKGCMGGFDLEGPFDEAKLTGTSTATLHFTEEAPVEASYTEGVAEGPEGLMEAVAALQAAVEADDIDTVVELHAPMLADAERMGMPADQIKGFIGWFFEDGKKTLNHDLQVEEGMDGKVFVVTTADREPPVEIVVTETNGKSMWRSGAYWAKIDGKWGVLSLF
ncbi:hypothetical protein KHP62_02440 [Rhodobacteraceae bacterium NNCM2]|nr:hypothetical protein [Coraliihabitans acroporae]